MTPRQAKPVFLITGFLGAGKTTLLNRLLERDDFAGTLVIVNEFGEVGLDHLLMEKSSDTILELSNGCLCCSVRGELVETLSGLDDRRFERIVIETTGIADPVPVFQTLATHPELASRFKPAGIITLVDAVQGEYTLDQFEEARNQLAIADLVYISKLDLADGLSPGLDEKVHLINSSAPVIPDIGLLTPTNIQNAVLPVKDYGISRNHDHSSLFNTAVLETGKELSRSYVFSLLDYLTSCLGNDILRIKGLVRVQEHPDKPLVVHVSGNVVHDFSKLEDWPENRPVTRLIAITKNTPASSIQALFDGFVGNLAPDTPDHQAITQNPLSIPGKKF